MAVVTKAPAGWSFGSSSSESGCSAQRPKTMKTAPVIHDSQCGAINCASQTPTEPASA
jgi:hypothetical protein